MHNTLYVQTQGTYLHLDHDTIRIDHEGRKIFSIPLHHLEGIVIFGNVLLSPFLIHRCAEEGRAIVWLTRSGRFKARVHPPVSGNVLLRHAQHHALADPERRMQLARRFVAAKIRNTRFTVMRSARDAPDPTDQAALQRTARELARALGQLEHLSNQDLDAVRGIEGEAARTYFASFTHMIRSNRPTFALDGRHKRPPRDPANALLSFLYTLLASDCQSALEAVGLDPQMGCLHALRPGRASLALDLLEEFRAPVADRLALTLINRAQLQHRHFDHHPGGTVYLNEEGRKIVLTAYQKRKQEEVRHTLLREPLPVGLLPLTQARVLARYLRGEMPHYPPYVAQ
nr:type I-C CRISPR-associated endonuclease Cas1c [Deinobacterium chartae]